MQTIKKTGTFQGKSNSLGGGGRFAQMTASSKSPALAAFIGRKLYGKKKMASMSAKGKKPAKKAAPAKVQPTQMSAPKGISVGNPNVFKQSASIWDD